MVDYWQQAIRKITLKITKNSDIILVYHFSLKVGSLFVGKAISSYWSSFFVAFYSLCQKSRHPFKGNPQNSFVSKGFWTLRFNIAFSSDYLSIPCQKIISWPIYHPKIQNANLRCQMQFKPYLYPSEWWQVSMLIVLYVTVCEVIWNLSPSLIHPIGLIM